MEKINSEWKLIAKLYAFNEAMLQLIKTHFTWINTLVLVSFYFLEKVNILFLQFNLFHDMFA